MKTKTLWLCIPIKSGLRTIIGVIFLSYLCNHSLSQGTWTQKTNFGGAARFHAVGFSIGTKGYIGTGHSGTSPNYTFYKDFWEWDQSTNAWTQKANFGGTPRYGAVGFSIGTNGYIGTGIDSIGTINNDFWEYDPASNVWTQKTNFGGTARFYAVSFSIGTKGYIGTGRLSSALNDFWEYDQPSDTWSQKTNLPTARFWATGFSIGTKGYIGTGYSTSPATFYNDFWEWNQATDTWAQKANFTGTARMDASGFSFSSLGKGYIGFGFDVNNNTQNDFYEYDQANDTWTTKATLIFFANRGSVGFSIGNNGYIGTGQKSDLSYGKDFWEYSTPTSVNESNSDYFVSVFPNPTNGQFVLQTSTPVEKIFIYSTNGEKIIQRVIPNGAKNITIDLSNQSNGIYFLQLKSENGTITRKIIKE